MHSFHDTIPSFLHLSLHLLIYLLIFNDSCPFNTFYNIIIIMIGHRNRFSQDVDLSESTSLTHLLNRHTREDDEDVETQIIGPKEYSLHEVGLLLLNAAQIVLTPPAPRNGGPFLPFFGQAGQVDPLVGWRCCY